MASNVPSAPFLPKSYGQRYSRHRHSYGGTGCGGFGQQQQGTSSSSSSSSSPLFGHSAFPPGTDPAVIKSFKMVDRDMSGYIDENELQQALSNGYQNFSLRTIRLLIFLFKSPSDPLRVGPNQFNALWTCLGQWRGIFEQYDKDNSGNIDVMELRDALYSLGLAVPPSVLQLLISKYDDGTSSKVELNFDSFVECGMIVKGLTDKFREKDALYSGIATFSHDAFMYSVIPFLVSYN